MPHFIGHVKKTLKSVAKGTISENIDMIIGMTLTTLLHGTTSVDGWMKKNWKWNS